MTWIPRRNSPRLQVGDKARTRRDIHGLRGTFTKGSLVRLWKVSESVLGGNEYFFTIMDNWGHTIDNVSVMLLDNVNEGMI